MSVFLQFISTAAILVLLGVTAYLSLPKYRQTAQAISHLLFRWFSILLLSILVMRVVVMFDPSSQSLLMFQRLVNSTIFLITVMGITWSVAKYERTNKR